MIFAITGGTASFMLLVFVALVALWLITEEG